MKSNRLCVLRIVALATILIACGPTQYVHHGSEASFLPETADSATPAGIRVVLVQDEPFVGVQAAGTPQTMPFIPSLTTAKAQPFAPASIQSTPTPALFGIDVLVTGIIDAAIIGGNQAINSIQKAEASTLSADLKGHGLGALFNSNLESSLSTAIGKSPWLHTTPLEMAQQPHQISTSEIAQHPIVQINVVYQLSYDASTFITQAHLFFFHKDNSRFAYSRYYTYFSEPVGPEQGAAAIAKWTSSDEALLRRRMTEGIHEVVAMLDRDFFNPVLTNPLDPSVTITCYDPINLNQVQWEGHILANENPRILFREKAGNIFSLVPLHT